ncbi:MULTISPECIES: SusC/RagA family TonB-linked outer membrane protein [Flavobacteriaceae]|uniref:SusC/RagA family TonB-linked outer membrane protein n=1 Tax=Flavobacteriaceae TaxID=49546 RepID=UPI001C0F0F91|nr:MULTISPECIES: SusC/RagA family TonB-linked outer membrane protein [Allomuricauda]MDC6366777.1 SusC/RagA family TonB-linked outer membrane protein [Muricauda sp. AC10]
MKEIKKVFMFLVCLVAFQGIEAQITVSGTITDAVTGAAIPAITVVEDGTTNGTSADFDGNYTINVPGDATLRFSAIGYLAQSVAVNGRTTINVVMQEDTELLDEVVVTALGISKDEKKLGYAVTEVGGESLNKAREVNVANSLTGQVAGLVVKGTSSGPGGSSKILLRGVSNLSGSGSPLFVIDGVPMDNTQGGSAGEWGGSDAGDGIGNLSPDDIEKMTVLKGQSASALYGSRASNGVILITTKKGSKQGDWDLTFNTNFLAESAVDFTDFQDTYGQGTGGAKPLTAADAQSTNRLAWGAQLDGSQVIGYDGNQYAYSPASSRYIDFYRTGTNFTNSIAVSKGWGEGSFRLSVSDLNSNSIVPNSGLDRTTVNLAVSQDITDKLNVSANINYTDQRYDNQPFLSDGPLNPNNFLFLAPNVSESIFAPGFDAESGAETVFSDDIYVTNPYFVTNQGVNDPTRKRTISIVSAKYNFTDNIYLLARIGNDQINDTYYKVNPYGLAYSQDLQGSLAELGQGSRLEFNADAIFGADFDLTEDLELSTLLGGNLRKNEYEKVTVNGGPFVLPYLYSYNNVVNFGRNYEFNEREVHSGYYSLGATYKDILTLTTTGRYDVYSTLTSPTSDDNSIFSPSVSGAFIFDDFLNIEALEYGKLRAAYAVTSGEPEDPYSNQFYYSSESSLGGIPAASAPTKLPNFSLKPFTTSELELGLDLKFFENRLSFDVAYFKKKSKDEIQVAGYSRSSGFQEGVVATGSIQNTGLEFLVTGVPIQKEDFSWTTSFNFTKVKNEVLKTDTSGNPINLGRNRATLGNAVTAFVVGEAGPQIMAYDYSYDGSGNIEVDESGIPLRGELKNFGSVLPDFYGGWNNTFNYKNFNLSFLIDFNYGNKVLSATEFYSIFRGLNKITLEGRETGVGSASAQDYYQGLAQNVTSTSVVDGDFIKLRQLSLGYTLPSELFERTPFLEGVDISLVARNLAILWRKAENIDPENGFGANVSYLGIEGTSLPSTRSIGLNVNFKIK